MKKLIVMALLALSPLSMNAQKALVGDGGHYNAATGKTEFCFVASPKAKKPVVRIYNQGMGGRPIKTVTLKRQPPFDYVWAAEVKGDLRGKFYTLDITGNRRQWLEAPGIGALAVGVNGQRGYIIDMKETNPEGWESDRRPEVKSPADLVIYEMHHRDFSIDPSSGISPEHRGKFLALTEPRAIDHLKRLGVNAIHILPSYDYGSVDETRIDEDLYLPFVQKMAASPLTKEDMRTAYRYEAQMCALNPRGSVAPDFVMTLRGGTQVRMHSVRAERTLLFFSNPGCHNCKEIIDALQADGNVLNLIREGRLAVLNIYIDEDLDAWRSYMPIYPKEWLNGYDAAHILRQDVLYNIRAIPSLYLLDAEKRILLKDAPLERVQEALIF